MDTPVAGGTLTLAFATANGAGGDVVWKVKIRQPKGYEYSMPELAPPVE
jgi:hypothetical protein